MTMEEHRSLKSGAVSGVKWSGFSMAAIISIQSVTLIILARLLTPTDFGLMGMILVMTGFAQLFSDMGISNAIIYRQNSSRSELSSLYWLNILAGAVVSVIFYLSGPFIISVYHEPRLKKLIYLIALIFFITSIGQQFQILLQKQLNFKDLAKIEIAGSIANSLVSILLAFGGLGVISLVYGQLAGTVCRTLFFVSWGWKNWRPTWHFSRKDLKGYINFGFYQMGEKTVNYFNTNLDYLLIGSLIGASTLGYYTFAYNLVLRPHALINPIINRVAFPIFSRVQNETDKLKKGYLKVLQLLSSANFPIILGIAAVAPIAIPIIFGEKWWPSVVLIQLLTIVGLMRSVGNPVGSLLLAKGKAGLGFAWNSALVIPQIMGLYLGARLGGAAGVAIAFGILMTLYTIFGYYILIQPILGSCLNEYIHSMWPSLWISGCMGIVVFVLGAFLKKLPPQFIFAVQVLCGIAVFMGLMLQSQKALVLEVKNLIISKKLA